MKNKNTANRENIPRPQFVRRGYHASRTRKKLGFDLHGVLDANSKVFRRLLHDLIRQGWEIHILTGARWEKEQETLKKLCIPFTHFFSITYYHLQIGTEIKWDVDGNPHMDDYIWSKTKAVYCTEHHITMHFDDSDIYGFFFKTPYVRYYSRTSERVRKMHL